MSYTWSATLRRAQLVTAVVSVVLLAGVAQPAAGTHPAVVTVKGFAYGYQVKASLFDGPINTRGYGQEPCTAPNTPPGCANQPASSSTPSLDLPTSGGNLSLTDPDGATGSVGPAILFSAGETTVSTQGTTGPNGSVTSSTTANNINKSGQEQFAATRLASSCSASGSAVSGSTAVTGGTLEIDSGDDVNPAHPPVSVTIPAAPLPNTQFTGHLHVNGAQDNWRYVFNEQVVNPDGSITVYAAHQYLLGPTAVGDLWVGRVDCGVATTPAPHTAPNAADDAYSTNEDAVLTVPAPWVLGNDSDAENDALSASTATGPSNGALVLGSDGSFSYTPAANFFGSDSFTYTVTDAGGGSDTATVAITVNAVNDRPRAAADSYGTSEDTTLTVLSPGVLNNDSDTEGGALSAAVATGPSNGTLALNTNGSFTYTPNTNFSGSDSFTYTASDAQGGSDTATVAISVTAVNDAPNAVDDAFPASTDAALTPPAPGVLGNDTDPDGGTLSAAVATGPTNGTLALAADGSFTYTPNVGFVGTDTFTYTASDGNGGSDTATVTLTVSVPLQADLSVVIVDDPDPVLPSGTVTYTVTVTNNGPATASAVSLSNTTVTGGTLKSVTPSAPTCTVSKGKTKVISCNLGDLASGGSTTITVVAQAPRKVGTMSLRATASSAVPDPDSANNTNVTQSTIIAR